MKGLVFLLMVLISSICTAGPQVVLTLDAPDSNISGLGYGAGSLWAVDKITGMVYRLDPADGTVQNSWLSENTLRDPAGLAFANNTIYVSVGKPPDLNSSLCKMYNTSGDYLGIFDLSC